MRSLTTLSTPGHHPGDRTQVRSLNSPPLSRHPTAIAAISIDSCFCSARQRPMPGFDGDRDWLRRTRSLFGFAARSSCSTRPPLLSLLCIVYRVSCIVYRVLFIVYCLKRGLKVMFWLDLKIQKFEFQKSKQQQTLVIWQKRQSVSMERTRTKPSSFAESRALNDDRK